MADFTITITNSFNTFGPKTDLWNEALWNAFKWGEGTNDTPVDVGKFIDAGSILPDSAIAAFYVLHLISESLSPTSAISLVTLQDSAGYFYVYPSNVTNHENQSLPTYTSGSTPSGTWTSATVGATVWS